MISSMFRSGGVVALASAAILSPGTAGADAHRGVPISAARELAESAAARPGGPVLEEILERNPELSAARERLGASREVAPQAGALPDPMLDVTTFLVTPETRVGPVRGSASVSQAFPSRGKRGLRRQAARERAASVAHATDALALSLVSEARRILVRLAYVDEALRILESDLTTLREFEELARARYATGRGIGQGIVKLQAEITRDETRLVAMRADRVRLVAELDRLRDAAAPRPFPPLPALAAPPRVALERDSLLAAALLTHPTVRASAAAVAEAEAGVRLARTASRPDVTLGLMYTVVGPRDDAAARIARPDDDGEDDIAIMAGINLPVRRERIDAGVRQAHHARGSAESERRAAENRLEKRLDELLARLPLIEEQWNLFSRVLLPQAEETQRATRFAYESGSVEVLDLLDTERVLLEVRLGAARALADWHTALVDLEETVARPLERVAGPGGLS